MHCTTEGTSLFRPPRPAADIDIVIGIEEEEWLEPPEPAFTAGAAAGAAGLAPAEDAETQEEEEEFADVCCFAALLLLGDLEAFARSYPAD
jgi:hypothetical protein